MAAGPRSQRIVPLIGSALMLLLTVFCDKRVTDRSDGFSVSVSFPLGRRAVHGVADYFEGADSSNGLQSVVIYSLQFDSIRRSGDTLHYLGTVRSFVPGPPGPPFGPDSGKITVSVDRRWVLFQNSPVLESFRAFMKRSGTGNLSADTTAPPSLEYNQFPVFPREPRPRTRYAVVRPDLNGSFSTVERTLDFGDAASGKDAFGRWIGLSFSTLHVLPDLDVEMRFTGVMDSHGIVVSQWRDSLLVTRVDLAAPSGYTEETVAFRRMNRRLADYSDPATLHPLSWYADRVQREGLEPLEETEETP
jgi:hypothetical protein